jgi:virulence-associated protein VagC
MVIMTLAKISIVDGARTVRLPEDVELTSDFVDVVQRGDEVVLVPKRKDLSHLIELIQQLPEDMFEGIKDERPPEEREDF